jgi:hypothetical protein
MDHGTNVKPDADRLPQTDAGILLLRSRKGNPTFF